MQNSAAVALLNLPQCFGLATFKGNLSAKLTGLSLYPNKQRLAVKLSYAGEAAHRTLLLVPEHRDLDSMKPLTGSL